MGCDKNEKKRIHRVDRLRKKHAELNLRTEELACDPSADPLLVVATKKEKLHTLDQLHTYAPELVAR